jgi:hypothetical protein
MSVIYVAHSAAALKGYHRRHYRPPVDKECRDTKQLWRFTPTKCIYGLSSGGLSRLHLPQ